MTPIEALIERLTEMQRRVLLQFPISDRTLSYGLTVSTLIANGVIDYRPRWFLFGDKRLLLTSRGKRMQAALRARTASRDGE